MRKSNRLGVLAIVILMIACTEESYIPKPIGYSRIDYVEHSYAFMQLEDCPFGFEQSELAVYAPVKAAEGQRCWFNLEFNEQQAKVHFSYLDITSDQLEKYVYDARKMAMEHLSRADDFEENVVYDPDAKVYGVVYNFQGGTASNMQFYLTDSVSHFIRGALYFEVQPNPDSLGPAEAYVEEEVMHLINTFRWEDN
jgi:gliding motility-associated lipoprotein GldD